MSNNNVTSCVSMMIGQEDMLRELRRPTSMPDYVDREDQGRYDRAVYDNENVHGTRRYYEQVQFRYTFC